MDLPIVHYKMNDNAATSTVVDAQVGHDGAARTDAGEINTDTINATGKINGALRFNGSSQYVKVSDHADFNITTTLSVCIWAQNDNAAIATAEDFCSKYNQFGDDREWFLFIDTNEKVNGIISVDGTFTNVSHVVSDAAVTDTTVWHFYAFTFDASGGAVSPILYLDGSVVASTEIGTARASINNGTSPIVIASHYTNAGTPTTSGHWDGLIDNVMIFDRALTPSEITELWNNGNGTEEFGGGRPRGRYDGTYRSRYN
ncbi:MAG TPA: LamG domain-containing protein [Porticoccus sp.]|nr:LamG domain-containing protein [Porticoccus sp.]